MMQAIQGLRKHLEDSKEENEKLVKDCERLQKEKEEIQTFTAQHFEALSLLHA